MQKSFQYSVALFAIVLASGPAFSQGADVWMRLYDEKDLAGWQGKPANWKVDTGGMVTASGATGSNTFLVTDSSYSDFHFKCDGRLGPTSNNSGLIYRGKITVPATFQMSGYQYEISSGGTAAFYHEGGNEIGFTRISGCYSGGVSNFVKMEIIADGPKVTHLVAGNKCFEKLDFKVVSKGQFGLQLHSPGNYTANFKNIFVKPLNNSFTIPANNAWDANGKKIEIVGIDIKPKRESANRKLGLPASVIGFDAQGRVVPNAAWEGLPKLILIRQ